MLHAHRRNSQQQHRTRLTGRKSQNHNPSASPAYNKSTCGALLFLRVQTSVHARTCAPVLAPSIRATRQMIHNLQTENTGSSRSRVTVTRAPGSGLYMLREIRWLPIYCKYIPRQMANSAEASHSALAFRSPCTLHPLLQSCASTTHDPH